MPHRQALGEQRALERERAADQERHEVVAPVLAQVGRLVDKLAVAPDAVAGQIGAQVGARRDLRRLGRAGVGDVEQRAGLRVGAAEEQEVERDGLRQRDEVRLGKAGGEAGGRPGVLARADRRSQRVGVYIRPS